MSYQHCGTLALLTLLMLMVLLRIRDWYLHLSPKTKLFQSDLFQVIGDKVDGGYDFLKEYLKDGVRPREAAAHVTRCSQQVLVLLLQTLFLSLVNVWLTLLWKNVVVIS